MFARRVVVSLSTLAVLAGCGGGGSSSGGTTTPPTNSAPVFSSAATANTPENVGGVVYQAAATDANGDTLTYSLGGADASRFGISASGQLSFAAAPNYDLPTDSDGDNIYRVQISASDGRSSTGLDVAITVTNSKEGISVRRVATGFATPTAISPVNETTVLVAEKTGAVYAINPQTGARTLINTIPEVGAVGVTALVAAPDYAASGRFFVMYTNVRNTLLVASFTRGVQVAGDMISPVFAEVAPNYAGGGWLGYGVDGVLLAATGDAGGSSDPSGSAQSSGSRLGKIVRIAPNPDPFGGASPTPFIFRNVASGLRRPNGGSLIDGNLFIADRGEAVAEEINLFALTDTTRNFGWPFKEGTRTVRPTPPMDVIDPILEYFRGTGPRQGQAIVGGVAGPATIASLAGQYLFADESGAIFAVPRSSLQGGTTLNANSLERRDLDFTPDTGTIARPVAIAAAPGGAVFILDADGELFRVDGG